MISPEQIDRVVSRLPVLQQAGPELLREFVETAFLARIPAGRDIFVEGDRVQSIALLISGVVRVYKIGETGREITLYRFGLGESCILTANAILSYQSFPAIATVERDAEAVMVPADVFRDWVGRFDLWRRFVFDLLALRLATVLAVVDEVAFRRMDARVSELLLRRSQAGHPLRITHQEIAAELGSSREVISRILEDFADRRLIRTGRGTIEIVDAQGLLAHTAV
jgi:CRP/FNR family transcriptional regulator